MLRYFTFKRAALAARKAWQTLRFTRGKGYWLFGTPPKPSQEFTMYDSTNVSQIPADAVAVAGYVNGKYNTYPALLARFPHVHLVGIDVNGTANADCLDVEKGDASNETVVPWVRRQQERGLLRPVVYTSVSNAAAVLAVLRAAGIPRWQVRLWTAHYTFKPHLCTAACGFGFTGTADATQYSDHALGRNLDVSLCAPDFF